MTALQQSATLPDIHKAVPLRVNLIRTKTHSTLVLVTPDRRLDRAPVAVAIVARSGIPLALACVRLAVGGRV